MIRPRFSVFADLSQALLDAVAEAACRGECQALIDTGAVASDLGPPESDFLGFRTTVSGLPGYTGLQGFGVHVSYLGAHYRV